MPAVKPDRLQKHKGGISKMPTKQRIRAGPRNETVRRRSGEYRIYILPECSGICFIFI
jgi:hypothetical protein